jgi:hypothetical protein
MTNPRDLISELQATHAKASLDDAGSFERMVPQLTALADLLRETYQASVKKEIVTVIAKLKKGGDLAPADVAVVESFMVGDAEAYTRLENDFQSWVAELGRLMGVLGQLSNRLEGRGPLEALGEVEDARRVLGDIDNFLEQKERVTRFRHSIAQGIDDDRRNMLIELLQELLESPGI